MNISEDPAASVFMAVPSSLKMEAVGSSETLVGYQSLILRGVTLQKTVTLIVKYVFCPTYFNALHQVFVTSAGEVIYKTPCRPQTRCDIEKPDDPRRAEWLFR
jgi:hypothetical protein